MPPKSTGQASLRAIHPGWGFQRSGSTGELLEHQGDGGWGVASGGVTSHVFLALVYDKGVATVRLPLLVSFLVGVGIGDDANLSKQSA